MKIRFGLIGCGRISTSHVNAISKIPHATITAISDPIIDRMVQIEKLYQSLQHQELPLKKYVDFTELVLDPEIDVVVIATSTGSHAIMAKHALVSGKHVVLEKPMALSLKEAKDIISLTETTKKILLVCHQMRYRPIIRRIKEIVDQGVMGEIYYGKASLQLHRSREYYLESPWRGTWSEDGGMLLNQGIHMVDLLVWLLGDVKEAYGTISKRNTGKETEDAALAILSFTNKSYGLVEANTISYPKNIGYELSLFGENGTIILGGPVLDDIICWQIRESSMDTNELDCLLSDKDDRYHMYMNLVECIHESKEVWIDAKAAYQSLETIFAIYQSSLIRFPVQFPLRAFSTSLMGRNREA